MIRRRFDLYKKFLSFSNYDEFILRLHPALSNIAFNISLSFLLQTILGFCFGIVACVLLLNSSILICLPAGLLTGILIFTGTQLLSGFLHKNKMWAVFIIILFIQTLLALLFAVCFTMFLFEDMIIGDLIIHLGMFKIPYPDIGLNYIKGFYLILTTHEERGIVLGIASSLFLIHVTAFVLPYVMIFINRNSSYYKLLYLYEQEFKTNK